MLPSCEKVPQNGLLSYLAILCMQFGKKLLAILHLCPELKFDPRSLFLIMEAKDDVDESLLIFNPQACLIDRLISLF
jgi:hypothetical protein